MSVRWPRLLGLLLAMVVSLPVWAERVDDGWADDRTAEGLTLPLTSLSFNDEADFGLFELSALQALEVPDPFEPWNRRMYHFNQRFDERVLLPVVKVYRFVLPAPVRTGLSNVFANLSDVGTLANSLLQLKPRRSLQMTGRVLVNTTIGVAGLWDPATAFGMPRYFEDFGQTLGRYGLPSGPYLVLPVLGPSNFRDTGGRVGDFLINEEVNFLNNAGIRSRFPPLTVVSIINERHITSFRYGQLNSPFEYEKLRYMYSKARELQVQD